MSFVGEMITTFPQILCKHLLDYMESPPIKFKDKDEDKDIDKAYIRSFPPPQS
jgi:hypothetical protein